MSKQDNRRMGSDPLAWINQEPEEKETLPEVPRNNIGRPRTIYRDYETSSEEGLPGNDTRWTVVVDKELKEALKDYQNTSEYPSMKALINDMVKEFFEKQGGYEMKQLGDITFYDVQEIAKAFDMTPQSIRKFLKEGRIKARKFGTRWYVTEEAMREYLLGIDNDNNK